MMFHGFPAEKNNALDFAEYVGCACPAYRSSVLPSCAFCEEVEPLSTHLLFFEKAARSQDTPQQMQCVFPPEYPESFPCQRISALSKNGVYTPNTWQF
jgi:hypothetical protein